MTGRSTGRPPWLEVERLRRERPKSRFLRASGLLLGLLVAASWLSGQIEVGELFSARRGANLRRFLSEDIVPFPLREEGVTLSGWLSWAAGLWRDVGREATVATFWIAVAAIVLAGGFAVAMAPLAARTLSTQEPYLIETNGTNGTARRRGAGWGLLTTSARLVCVSLRAIPEYVIAFFLVAMLPGSAWPAVLALAIHNGGILGRLYGDTLENLDAGPMRSLRMLGAGRRDMYLLAAFPTALPRFLLYFFYRFETCVREATVLGMLGIVSLGSYIAEARVRHFYDEMLLLVGFGVGMVLAGDLASYLARGWVRRAR